MMSRVIKSRSNRVRKIWLTRVIKYGGDDKKQIEHSDKNMVEEIDKKKSKTVTNMVEPNDKNMMDEDNDIRMMDRTTVLETLTKSRGSSFVQCVQFPKGFIKRKYL